MSVTQCPNCSGKVQHGSWEIVPCCPFCGVVWPVASDQPQQIARRVVRQAWLWGGLSLVPVVGVVAGVLGLLWGFLAYRRGHVRTGAAALLLSAVVGLAAQPLLAYWAFGQYMDDSCRQELATIASTLRQVKASAGVLPKGLPAFTAEGEKLPRRCLGGGGEYIYFHPSTATQPVIRKAATQPTSQPASAPTTSSAAATTAAWASHPTTAPAPSDDVQLLLLESRAAHRHVRMCITADLHIRELPHAQVERLLARDFNHQFAAAIAAAPKESPATPPPPEEPDRRLLGLSPKHFTLVCSVAIGVICVVGIWLLVGWFRKQHHVAAPPSASRKTWRAQLLEAYRHRDVAKWQAILTLTVGPALAVLLIFVPAFRPFISPESGDREFYGLIVPVTLAGGLCLAMGLLGLARPSRGAMRACTAAMILTGAAYLGATLLLDLSLWHGMAIGYLALPALALMSTQRSRLDEAIATTESLLAAAGQGGVAPQPTISKAGNRGYTGYGLTVLFTWLLWFDFCFMMMEGVLGNILSFRVVNDLGADNKWLGLMGGTGTVMTIIGMVMLPWISVASDRHRGPRGRRVPYLMYASPVVCVLLAVMGFGNEIGTYIHANVLPQLVGVLPSWLGGEAVTGAQERVVIIWTFLVLNLLFSIANIFLSTVFWYLFNDVVPREHIVKFMAYTRIVGALAAMLYNIYIFGYSDKSGPLDISLGFWSWGTDSIWYPKVILVSAAVAYMCLGMITYFKMKEPDYPPPDPLPTDGGFLRRVGGTIGVLVKECFSHRFYMLIFVWMILSGLADSMGMWKGSMKKSLGIDLHVLGQINGWTTWIGLILYALTANLGDRVRAMPLMVVAAAAVALTAPIGLLYLIPGLPADWYLGIEVAYILTHIPVNLVLGMASGPLLMELFPRDRYGQFSAAGSLLRNVLCGMIAVPACGFLLDEFRTLFGGSDYYLRFAYTWQVFFQVALLGVLLVMYRRWLKLGGARGYQPPPVRTVQST